MAPSSDAAPTTMYALAKCQPGPGLDLIRVPIPEPEPGQVRIRVGKTAICGTDLHIYTWDAWAQKTIKPTLIAGHEFSGTIDKIGPHTDPLGLKLGDRVSGEGHITCSQCRNCRAGNRHLCRQTLGVGVNRQGAFAEYLCLPVGNVFKLREEIDDEVGSLLDPLGNAVHTALSFDLVGEDVLITGAGPIGLMATAVARQAGARHIVVTDVNPLRLSLALSMGASRAVDVSKQDLRAAMAELGMVEGFDVGLEMSGQPAAMRSMLDTLNHGGKLALLGIFADEVAIDWSHVVFKGLTIKGIYGRQMFETWYKMAALIQGGLSIKGLITHRFGFKDYAKAFSLMKEGKAAKVVLSWGDKEVAEG